MKLSEMKRIKQERLKYIQNNSTLSTGEITKNLNVTPKIISELK